MRVSIVVNNHNYAAFVGRAIDSALEQTHADTEVLVVDDGSTDGSRAVIAGYNGRVRTLLKPNGGQGSAYNAGFAAATGEVVFFLDADDWLYPQAAARAAAAFAGVGAGAVAGEGAGNTVSKVQFQLDIVDGEGRPQGRRLPREMHDDTALALLGRFAAYGTPPGSGNAYSAALLRQLLPMEEPPWRTAADSVPILLAPAHGRVVSLREPLGAYRVHKKATPDGLLFNNEPKGLWPEYDRIRRCKDLVVKHFSAIGRPLALPPLLAPWEARVLALCLRFGPPGQPREPVPRLAGMGLALRSVWSWPGMRPLMRVAQSGWMLCVWLLPQALARRIGRVDRALKGGARGR